MNYCLYTWEIHLAILEFGVPPPSEVSGQSLHSLLLFHTVARVWLVAYLIEFNSSFQFKLRKRRRRRRSPTNNNTIGNARYFYFAHFSNVTMSVIYYKWFFNRNGILNGQVIQPSNYNCLRCLWFRPSMDGSIYGRRLGEDNYYNWIISRIQSITKRCEYIYCDYLPF